MLCPFCQSRLDDKGYCDQCKKDTLRELQWYKTRHKEIGPFRRFFSALITFIFRLIYTILFCIIFHYVLRFGVEVSNLTMRALEFKTADPNNPLVFYVRLLGFVAIIYMVFRPRD